MRSRTVRGYKSWQGMQAALMLTALDWPGKQGCDQGRFVPARDQGQEAISWLSGAKEDVNRAGQGVIF